MSGHGPDRAAYEKATSAELKPVKIENTMAFMFETRWVLRPTRWAAETPLCQLDYDDVWSGFIEGRPVAAALRKSRGGGEAGWRPGEDSNLRPPV